MKLHVIKSEIICRGDDLFTAHLGYGNYDLGIQVHKWGCLRIMLIWWHICIIK